MPFVIAHCSAELSADSGEFQILPAGHFRAWDGRPHEVASWFIDAKIASKIVDALNSRETLIDYEHHTLKAMENGIKAPAAGWFKGAEWREGQGLFAKGVVWNAAASEYIRNKEYRFISPLLITDPLTGEVLDIRAASLTNLPAIEDMRPLIALSAYNDIEVKPMKHVAEALGLSQDASEQHIIAAINTLKSKESQFVALSAQIDSSSSTIAALQAKVAEYEAHKERLERESMIKEGLSKGQLSACSVDWANSLSLEALRGFLQVQPTLEALSGKMQSHSGSEGSEVSGWSRFFNNKDGRVAK